MDRLYEQNATMCGVLCYDKEYKLGVNMPKGIGYPKGMKKKSTKGKKKKK
jgi:hypothetical protein